MGKGTGPLVGQRPKVGQWAKYKDGRVGEYNELREVTDVSPNGTLIKLRIKVKRTNWLLASRFVFQDEAPANG